MTCKNPMSSDMVLVFYASLEAGVGGPAQTLQLFQTPFIAIFLCYNCSSR